MRPQEMLGKAPPALALLSSALSQETEDETFAELN